MNFEAGEVDRVRCNMYSELEAMDRRIGANEAEIKEAEAYRALLHKTGSFICKNRQRRFA